MGMYNITGWSGGGRRPLTYNLKAGQFRSLGGANIFGFPGTTVINNNFGKGYGGYGFGHDCGNTGMPKWMAWCMGGGMIMQMFGQMLGAIFPGRDGAGGTVGGADQNKVATDKANMQSYANSYKDSCTISAQYNTDGTFKGFIITDKETKQRHTVDSGSVDDLQAKLQELYDGDSKAPDTATTKYPKEVGKALVTTLKAIKPDANINYNHETGKFEYNNKEYDYEGLKAELGKASQTPQNPPNAKGANEGGGTPPANTTGDSKTAASDATQKEINSSGKLWWQIAEENYDTRNLTPAEKTQLYHEIKDATDKNEYGSGVSYNSKVMPAKVKLPQSVTIGDKTVTLKNNN